MLFPSVNELLEENHLEQFPPFFLPIPHLDVKFNIYNKDSDSSKSSSDLEDPPSPIVDEAPVVAVEVQSKKKNECAHSREFTKEEDMKLIKLVNLVGKDNWFIVGKLMETKSGRECKDRWMHYLNPKGPMNSWTFEEDLLLVKLFSLYGPKWTKIGKNIPGRTVNSIRNRWKILLRHSQDPKSKIHI